MSETTINASEYSTIFQNQLDKSFVEQSTTGWMEANAGNVIYNGGKYIKIPTLNIDGLKDYDRKNGYPSGSVELSYQTMEMTKDRSTSFLLDAMDVNETNFVASAGNVSSEFQRTQVIPEVDSYRYSKIYAEAENGRKEYTVDEATVFEAFIDDIAYVQDIVGENEPLVASISGIAAAAISKLKDFQKLVDTTNFVAGTLNTKVKTINDVPLFKVPSARMYTSYVFKDGKTEGQEQGGFEKGETAKQMNWIIMPRRAVIAVAKQDNMKIITPQINQTADAWKLTYRKYHDLWIKQSYLDTIRCNIAE